MTAPPPGTGTVLATLALGDGGPTRGLYWRGDGRPDGHGGLAWDAGGAVDLGTWFNAAPVGWWHAVVGIDAVRLRMSGNAEVTVHRSSRPAGGPSASERVSALALRGEAAVEIAIDGADWLWVALRGAGSGGTLDSLTWEAVSQPPASAATPAPGGCGTSSSPVGAERRGQARVPAFDPARDPARPGGLVTVVVPTYRREHDALDQVRRLLAPELADAVARVVLVDQAGTVRRASDADAVLAAAGERLMLVEQDNLGGSGGYARGMLESLAFRDDAVLLLDDDARIDPEGLRRMLAVSGLAAAAGHPTILGTPLLSAEAPTNLEALAEGVRRRDFRWGPTDRIGDGVDVSATDPAGWSFADPAAPIDYTGWWGTLLPPGTVAVLGLPAPYFLKWDDAEYGLRAGRAGYRVATLPGTGVWHPTWAAKGTISSWAAWPLHRNRLATAAAYRAGRGVLIDSLVHQVKHVLSLQYQTADLWDAALAQFVAGPGWLSDSLRTTRSRAQTLLDEVSGRPSPVAGESPVPGRAADAADAVAAAAAAAADSPLAARGLALQGMRAAVGLVRRNRMASAVRTVPAEFTWRTGLGRDAVLLDGPAAALVRDPARARAALRRTVRLHARAALRWNSLRGRYAAALPDSRTEKRWRALIGG